MPSLLLLLLLLPLASSLNPLLSRRALPALLLPLPASATFLSAPAHSYPTARPDREWQYILTPEQYNILRQGGTERPNSSILVSEKRPGTFLCAGCRTPLFSSESKFESGTGWPSFATALPGVELTSDNPAMLLLAGVELKCRSCGGHLGDAFGDGKLFPNTPAFASGRRHCIDGYALIFAPADGSAEVVGDTPGKKKELPKWLEAPPVTAREKT